MRIVVYDLETKTKPETKADWVDYPKMGISVGCSYDFSTGEYGVYLDDNLGALIDLLNSADMVTAFNHVHFDNKLLTGVAAHLGIPQKLDIRLNYDMLVESRAGAKVGMFAKGFKLDAHLKATLGDEAMKTGSGAMAPDLYQAGKLGEVISYCLADVHRERLLFRHIWKKGFVACENRDGHPHQVRPPQELLGVPVEMTLDALRMHTR